MSKSKKLNEKTAGAVVWAAEKLAVIGCNSASMLFLHQAKEPANIAERLRGTKK